MVADMWLNVQRKIAESVVELSGQDGLAGGVAAALGASAAGRYVGSALLGVDMSAEQDRANRLNAALGLDRQDLVGEARANIGQQFEARQAAFSDRIGQFMGAFAEFADPAALRAVAEARRQELADARERQRLAREAQRQEERQAFDSTYAPAAIDAGIEAAQTVASSGTFSAWAINAGMFGGNRQEQQLAEANTHLERMSRHTEETARVLRRGGVILV
jgi:hypothetical protein